MHLPNFLDPPFLLPFATAHRYFFRCEKKFCEWHMAASVCIVLPLPAQITSKFHDTIYEEYIAAKADFLDLFDVLLHKGDSKIKLCFLLKTTLFRLLYWTFLHNWIWNDWKQLRI